MAGRIAGWVVNASANAAIATAAQPAAASRQHIIFALELSFSATPSAPVQWELLDGAASPGTKLAGGYVLTGRTILFPEGLAVPVGHAVSCVLDASSGIGEINLHGITQ